MEQGSVWLEAALNGPWSRTRQKLIPVTIPEIIADGIACARAGAAIIHVHAYDAETGRQNDDPETYVRLIEGIREVEDVIVYPTIPFAVTDETFAGGGAARRYAAVEYLANRGLLEWAVVDPGSINLTTYEDAGAGQMGSLYLNPEDHVRRGLELAMRHRFTPSYAIYEPGFLRLGAALAQALPALPAPMYRFMFTDAFTFGFPPEPFALEAYLTLLSREAGGARWMAAGLGVDILQLIPSVVARGGHVRVGLEDAPLGTDVTNVSWVEKAVREIIRAERSCASATDIRGALFPRPAPDPSAR